MHKKTLIYQMYPSAWGNFKNMQAHLDRVKFLKPDYIWLSPFYDSPWHDGGYDVSNYKTVNPRFGTLEDFDCFVEKANSLGIKVLIDLVMNHTSTEHEWFKKSVANNPEYRDYYIWTDRDLCWGNQFDGGAAFKWNDSRQQYYLHLFHETQADLNWDNPKVLQEFREIIDFWVGEHGVSGFRLDVVAYLCKKLRRSFLPQSIAAGFLNFWQKPKTLEILHQLFDGRGLFTLAEAGSPSKRMMRKLAGKMGPLTAAFNVIPIGFFWFCCPNKIGLSYLWRSMRRWASEEYYVAAIESHDLPRLPSEDRIGSRAALKKLFGTNPHMVCLYQGQELGLNNPILSEDINEYEDAQTIMRYHRMIAKGVAPEKAIDKQKKFSRDNARKPIDLAEYDRQMPDQSSVFNLTCQLIEDWRSH